MHRSVYGTAILDDLREQIEYAGTLELYANRFEEAGFDPTALESWSDFEGIPFTTGADIVADIETDPPEGTLYPGGSMLSFTPSGDNIFPVFETERDLEVYAAVNARIFEAGGIEPGDRVLVTFGYHLLGTGYVLHRGLEELGAEIIPAGPGNTEQTARIVDEYGVDVLMANPSFAMKLAEEIDSHIPLFAGAGEPFTSVPGMRAEVKDALGAETAFDFFGTRWSGNVAAECAGETGMHVATDLAIIEIIDPDTEAVLPPGEQGEIVVTHRRKEGMPLVRYRTGDLGQLTDEPCKTCGRSVTLPGGILGRTDNRVKAKGVKLYPGSINSVLSGFDSLSGEFRVEVTQPDSTDHIRVICQGTAPREELRIALTNRLLIEPDLIEFVEEVPDGPIVVDERYS